MPTISNEICTKLFILDGQVVTCQLGNKKVRYRNANQPYDGRYDERPAIAEVILDGLEHLLLTISIFVSSEKWDLSAHGSNGCTSFPNSSGETIASAADGGGVALRAH